MEENETRASATPKDKLAVYGAVSAACEDICKTNTLVGTFSVERDAKLLIAELVYKKLEDAAEDLEAFAGHAKRNNINADDIKLLFRKNAKIVEMLKTLEETDEKEKPPAKRKRTEPEPSVS